MTHVVVAVEIEEFGTPFGIDDEPVGRFASIAAQMMAGRHGVRNVDGAAQFTGSEIVAEQPRACLSREGRPVLLALLEDSTRCLDTPDQVVDHQQIAARVGTFPEVLSVGQRKGVGAVFPGGQHNVLVDHDDSAAAGIRLPNASDHLADRSRAGSGRAGRRRPRRRRPGSAD